jgi:hypothetical protein
MRILERAQSRNQFPWPANPSLPSRIARYGMGPGVSFRYWLYGQRQWGAASRITGPRTRSRSPWAGSPAGDRNAPGLAAVPRGSRPGCRWGSGHSDNCRWRQLSLCMLWTPVLPRRLQHLLPGGSLALTRTDFTRGSRQLRLAHRLATPVRLVFSYAPCGSCQDQANHCPTVPETSAPGHLGC